MTATINGTLIACNLQLTPDILSLFHRGYLSVVNQQSLEEVDLLAASTLFDLSEALASLNQEDFSHSSLPTDERRVDGTEGSGPSGAGDEATAGETVTSSASSLSDESSVTDTPPSRMTPGETAEVPLLSSAEAFSYEVPSNGPDHRIEEVMSAKELEEAWFDFESYQSSSCTEPSTTVSSSPVSHSQSAARMGTNLDEAENEIAAREGDIDASENNANDDDHHDDDDDDDDVIIIDIRPASGAVRTDQDHDAVTLDTRSVQPRLEKASRTSRRKRRRVDRSSVVPYSLSSPRRQRSAERSPEVVDRWTSFTGLWAEICIFAMERPSLSRAIEAMDGYVRLVEDDGLDFQLWKDPLRQHWRELKRRWEQLRDGEAGGKELQGIFKGAGRLLKAVLNSC